jgi:transcriptional regulator with XRE-family HTH domain
MSSTLKQFKKRALATPGVKREYERLAPEFALLDAILAAREAAGLTQADVAKRIGTTQSAIARFESRSGRHSPTIATLERYAQALGYTLQVRFIKEPGPSRSYSRAANSRKRTPHK